MFRRSNYRSPSPFFSPATSVRRNPSTFFSPTSSDQQRPHQPESCDGQAFQPAECPFSRRRGVVSIPVVDVDEDRGPQPVKVPRAAAVRIQSAFRGHTVRKALARVRALDVEVRGIEARVRESIGRIATDERERLLVGEMVMRVLLKLDGVRGVRDYRKKVVRRAVKLQEMIDSLAARGDGVEGSSGDEEVEEEGPRGAQVVDGSAQDEETGDFSVGGGYGSGTAVEEAGVVEESKNTEKSPRPMADNTAGQFNAEESTGGITDMVEESTSKACAAVETPSPSATGDDCVMEEGLVTKPDAMVEASAGTANAEGHATEEGSVTKPDAMETTLAATVVGNGVDAVMDDATSSDLRDGDGEPNVALESSVEIAPEKDDGVLSDCVVVDNAASTLREDSRKDKNSPATTPSCEGRPEVSQLELAPSTSPSPILPATPIPVLGPVEEAVGHMTQENERLRGMVEELLQRSALQCRLVCQLTRRVESLEKKVEKLGKKKRKHAGDASAIAATDKKD